MAKANNRVFIVDDDAMHNDMLKKFFEEKYKVQVMAFTNGDDAFRNLEWNPTYVFCDYHLDRMNTGELTGADLMRRIRQALPNAYVVMMSAQDKLDIMADAMKHGAFDHVVKNTTGFLRIGNVMNHAMRMARFRATVKAYQTATIIFGTFLLVAVAVIIFLLRSANSVEPVITP